VVCTLPCISPICAIGLPICAIGTAFNHADPCCPVLSRPVLQEDFFLAFAKFEEIVKEFDRARAIYKYALDQLPRGAAQQLYETFNKFEKQHGSRCAAV
jgi:hypothetical protein